MKPIRRTRLPRGTKAPRRSPYLHKSWLTLRRMFLAWCRAERRLLCWRCDSRRGRQVHHTQYAPGRGWRRLIVPLTSLQLLCAECHAAVEQEKAAKKASQSPAQAATPFLESAE